jgi:hypothetical protein
MSPTCSGVIAGHSAGRAAELLTRAASVPLGASIARRGRVRQATRSAASQRDPPSATSNNASTSTGMSA